MPGSLFDKSATLQRQNITQDPSGAIDRSYTTVASFTAGIWPAGTQVRDFYARQQMSVNMQVATFDAIDARIGDLVIVGSDSYIVHGAKPFSNTAINGNKLTVLDCEQIGA